MSDGSVIIDTKLNNKDFKNGINELESIGKKGLKGLTVATGTAMASLATLGGYAVKVGSDFESGMSKVQAISGATGEEIETLTQKAKEMGAKTKFSASESAEAFQYMAMAGWKTGDMLNGIEGIMNLAAAAGENLGSVSDIVTDALTAFGLQAKDSGHFADVLAKASSNSNTNVGLMGETFKYVAPLAGSMKYSIEDTAVAIGLMANAGIKGSQSGTALRSMLTRLVKPPKEVAVALDKLNISAKNSDGTMKPLSQTMKELRDKFANLSESQKASYAASIAGQEAMSGMLAIVNASDDDFNKLTKAINNSDGATKEMAETMNNNLKGATTIMKSNMESLGLAIYEKFKGPATKGIKSVTEALEKLTKDTSNGKLSKSLDKIASSFGKLIEKGAKLMSKVLPKLIDGLAWVLDNGKTIAKVVGTITGAIAILKTTAMITNVINCWKKAVLQLNLFEIATMKMGITQGLANANLTLGQTAVALLTGKISLATVAQKLWNMAMAANPIGIVTLAVAGLTAGLVYLVTRQTESQKKAKEFSEQMSNSKKDFEEYNENINKTTKANLSQINSVSKLKDELKTLVDENGRVKKGYESRVDFILNQLNEALGTEYKKTGEVIEKYKDLAGEIDKLIDKKKAEIILEGKKEKWAKANEEEETATKDLADAYNKLGMSIEEAKDKRDTLRSELYSIQLEANPIKELFNSYRYGEIEELENLISAYENSEARVKQCVENKKDYENSYAMFVEEKYGEIGNTIKDTTSNWSNENINTIKNTITKEKESLELSKSLYEKTGSDIYLQQQKQSKLNLENLATELILRRKTLGTLGQDEIEAWKSMAEESYDAYSMALANIDPTIRQEIQNAVGIIVGGTPEMQAKAEELGRKTVEEFDKSAEAKEKALNTITAYLKGLTDDEKREFLKQAGIENADIIIDELNKGDLSEQNGRNILEGLWRGLKNNSLQGKILGVASGLAHAVNNAFTGKKGWDEHSPSKKMRKFAEYYIQPIPDVMKKRQNSIVNTSRKLAETVNSIFNNKLAGIDIDKTYEKMKATVEYETSRLSANLTTKAMLQVEKDQVRTVTNDNGVTINNTQQFYSKNSTPYEEQKQAKQQLRRLAYGL